MGRLFPVVFVIACSTPLVGQTVHMHGEPAGNPVKTLPSPVMIPGVGNSHLAITTSSPQAQKWFDQGLSPAALFFGISRRCGLSAKPPVSIRIALCVNGASIAMEFGGSADDDLRPVVTRMKELAPGASDYEQRYIRSIVESAGKKGEEASQAYQREMENNT